MTAALTAARMAEIHASAFTTPRPWSEAEFSALLADPTTLTLTESQGFLLGRVVAGEAEILTLAVAPEGRRQGTARRLVAGFLQQASVRGAESAFLEVAASNHAALDLYESCGFSLRGSRKNYYRDAAGRREDALVLVLAL